ncbi:MAG: hypothetical protein K0Q49_1348 [Haloplasmataceae bacterium]|jgi:NAD(P)-dependent dehydrogenase (short-subunit alcohol dehydrogenase family)|nr:hypothetical protein [Haloplasmataceae bacterium]
MSTKVLITGADRGLGNGVTKKLLEKGFTVFAGQFLKDWLELDELKILYPNNLHVISLDVSSEESVKSAFEEVSKLTDYLDIVINNAGITEGKVGANNIFDEQDYEAMLKCYEVNALGCFKVVHKFLPLLEKGNFKRLCFVSSEAGSIERSTRKEMVGYCMSKSALNMMVKILFNLLRPKGYVFRLYHPGWVRSYMSGVLNVQAELNIDEAAMYASNYFLGDNQNEDTLELMDYKGEKWPW